MDDLPDIFIGLALPLTIPEILLRRDKGFLKRNLIEFPKGQTAQLTDRDPAGQRIADTFHMIQLCRPRQDELSPFLRMVNGLLDLLENRRLFLYLIDDQRAGMVEQEELRFFPRLKPGERIVEADIVIVRKCVSEQRGFVFLTRLFRTSDIALSIYAIAVLTTP